MPNDAVAEKAGTAEHGDGATVRCHHDSNSPMLVVEEPIQAIEQPINLADESAQPSGPTTRPSEVTLIGSNFERRLEWRTARSGNANAHSIYICLMKAHSTGGRGTTVIHRGMVARARFGGP